MDYELRDATSADRAWVFQLEDRCYREVIERQFGSFERDRHEKHFAEKWEPSRYRMIVCDGRDAGILCTRDDEDGSLFLSEIQIDPEFQNQGLGTRILSDLFSRSQRQGRTIRLQVLRQSRAIRLYLRLGFSKTGETETHVLMEKIPGGAPLPDADERTR